MIVLHQFPPAFGLINASPFCIKLEAWLRLTGLAYRVAPLRDLGQAPKGKGPYIEDGARRIGDSALIIEHLKRTRGVDPDAGLTAAQRAVGRAIGLMLEDHLYFVALHNRWLEEAHWPHLRDTVLAGMPAEMQEAVGRDVAETMRRQGLGRHGREELYALGVADLEALADALGDQPFLFGEQPTTVDCIAFAFVHGELCPLFDGPLRQALLRRPSLLAYERRLRERLFPEAAPPTA